jgi:tetratricopeptide (TPR) repeat protein
MNSSKTAIAFSAILASTLVAGATSARADEELLNILGVSGQQERSADAPETAKRESLIRKVLQKAGAKFTAEANIFVQFFDQGDMEKALYQWPAAFEKPNVSAFARSATGRAIWAYLMFRNGLVVTGAEAYLAIEKPTEIASEVQGLWREAANDTHLVWSLVDSRLWKPAWGEILGVATEVRVRGRQLYNPEQMDQLKDLLKKAQVNTRERAWIEWQTVLNLALTGDAGIAGKALANLMKKPNNPVSQDLMTMTAARLLFQNGYLDAAISYYQRIPKNSDFWIDAQEETGWAYIRKGEPQNTIALTKTLMNPGFTSLVSPEVVFLRSLGQLKVCDYPETIATLKTFRERFKPRTEAMIKLAEESPDSTAVRRFIERRKAGEVRLAELGQDAREIPRYITRDEMLAQMVQVERELEKEAKTAGELFARSLTGGTAEVGFQARFDQLKQAVESRARAARSVTLDRVKSLAREEIQETQQILQKLHIVEAEVIQQLGVSKRVADASAGAVRNVKTGSTGSQAKDRIWFPAESETWFDELANYKVDVKKGCQARR